MNLLYKHICLLAIIVGSNLSYGQVTIERYFIGSGGQHVVGSSGKQYTYSIGEVATTTISNNNYVLTQGFQQPSFRLLLDDTELYTSTTPETCDGAQDGIILIDSIIGPSESYSIKWKHNDTVLSQQHATNLSAEEYTLTITGTNPSVEKTFTVTVDLKNDTPCELHIYSGVTPNGDGHNDTWIIDHIELFEGNNIVIFNRWGNEIWTTTNYDNTSNYWDGKNKQDREVPTGTYFYVATIGNNIHKGWIELTR